MANVRAPPFTVVSSVKGEVDWLKSGFGKVGDVEVDELIFVCVRMDCVAESILGGVTVDLSGFAVVETEVASSKTVISLNVDRLVLENCTTVEGLEEAGTVKLMNFEF